MDKTDVAYDPAEGAWVATRAGEVLDRNHQIPPDEELGARKWLAWLTGTEVPLTNGERTALAAMMGTSGIGVGSGYAMLRRAVAGMPGHCTDEYAQWDVGLLAAMACTSLDDEQALARARICPSGTSGGWLRDDRRSAQQCPDRPDTHRHLMFEAG